MMCVCVCLVVIYELGFLIFGCLDEVGSDGWNHFEDNYAFVYSKPEAGSKKVLVKCLVMNDSLLVDALRDGDSDPLHLEIKYDLLSALFLFFPRNYMLIDCLCLLGLGFVCSVGEYVVESGDASYSSQFKNMGKLVSVVEKEILGKLDGSKSSTSTIKPAGR